MAGEQQTGIVGNIIDRVTEYKGRIVMGGLALGSTAAALMVHGEASAAAPDSAQVVALDVPAQIDLTQSVEVEARPEALLLSCSDEYIWDAERGKYVANPDYPCAGGGGGGDPTPTTAKPTPTTTKPNPNPTPTTTKPHPTPTTQKPTPTTINNNVDGDNYLANTGDPNQQDYDDQSPGAEQAGVDAAVAAGINVDPSTEEGARNHQIVVSVANDPAEWAKLIDNFKAYGIDVLAPTTTTTTEVPTTTTTTTTVPSTTTTTTEVATTPETSTTTVASTTAPSTTAGSTTTSTTVKVATTPGNTTGTTGIGGAGAPDGGQPPAADTENGFVKFIKKNLPWEIPAVVVLGLGTVIALKRRNEEQQTATGPRHHVGGRPPKQGKGGSSRPTGVAPSMRQTTTFRSDRHR